MKKCLFLFLCLVLALASCEKEKPRDPDPRDISPDSVAYILSSLENPTAVIENRDLIAELTDSLNGLRSELGVYDEESWFSQANVRSMQAFPGETSPYEGWMTFYDESGAVLAHVAFYDGKVYRDYYAYESQRTLLFDRKRLNKICQTNSEGVSSVTSLYFELIGGADKLWIEDTQTGQTAVLTDREQFEPLSEYFMEVDFRKDEPCGEEEPYRFQLRWTYTEEDELLEHVEIGEDGRAQVRGNWCTPMGRPIDMDLLERLAQG